MNVGFYEPNDTSTAAWIDFKLSYVEEAESITYNIPGEFCYVARTIT